MTPLFLSGSTTVSYRCILLYRNVYLIIIPSDFSPERNCGPKKVEGLPLLGDNLGQYGQYGEYDCSCKRVESRSAIQFHAGMLYLYLRTEL